MDDVHGKRTTQEFIPHSSWTEDSMGRYLSVLLPGFQKEELMVGLAYPGYVTISGERMVNDEKCIYFSQALRLPENLDTNKIGQTFEGEMLCLTFPKGVEENKENVYSTAKENAQEELTFPKRVGENKEHVYATAKENVQEELSNDENHDQQHGLHENQKKSKQTNDHVVSVHNEMRKKGSILEMVIELLKDNIIFTGVLAFSLGAFMSLMFESNG